VFLVERIRDGGRRGADAEADHPAERGDALELPQRVVALPGEARSLLGAERVEARLLGLEDPVLVVVARAMREKPEVVVRRPAAVRARSIAPGVDATLAQRRVGVLPATELHVADAGVRSLERVALLLRDDERALDRDVGHVIDVDDELSLHHLP